MYDAGGAVLKKDACPDLAQSSRLFHAEISVGSGG